MQDDWVDHGLGMVEEGENAAWFKVISWPSANLFREDLGLPSADFHITLGFRYKDIHGVSKGKKSLMK